MAPSLNQHLTGWTDECVAEMKKLWLEGLSAAEIARRIRATSRNAVIAKVHRLGLSRSGGAAKATSSAAGAAGAKAVRGTGPRPPREFQLEAITTVRPRALPQPVVELLPGTAPAAGKDLLQLGRDQCRWPVAGPVGEHQRFCARATPESRPYCLHHAAIARGPKQPATDIVRDVRRYI